MARKAIFVAIILLLIIFLGLIAIGNENVDVYIDGENVSVTTHTLNPKIDTKSMNRDICKYTVHAMNDTTTNVSTLKEKLGDICKEYGMNNPKIKIDSTLGKDQIPVFVIVDGTSMLPTLKDGQMVLLNKTHNIHVGDIVVANSDEYGGIIKRVDKINGDSVYLVSDNKNITYEYINGRLYETKGITTWVDISDINGVAIEY